MDGLRVILELANPPATQKAKEFLNQIAQSYCAMDSLLSFDQFDPLAILRTGTDPMKRSILMSLGDMDLVEELDEQHQRDILANADDQSRREIEEIMSLAQYALRRKKAGPSEDRPAALRLPS